MKRKYLVALVVAVIAAMLGAGAVAAASADPKEKVGVCHRTASETNPYVYIEVPQDEANGHITGTDKQHNHKVYWESAGTWRGVAHAAGDERVDYYASSSTDCQDLTTEESTSPSPSVPPPSESTDTDCPEGETDYNGAEPGCGTPPEVDNPEPETPTLPTEETKKPKPHKPTKPHGQRDHGDQPVRQPVEVPTVVAAGM